MAAVPWIPLSISLSVMVLVVVFAFRYRAAENQRFREAWRAFASSRGYAWKESAGPWYRRPSDSIDATVEGAPVKLDTYVVSSGKHSVTFTRVSCTLLEAPRAKIRVGRRSFLTAIAERFGWKTVAMGDPVFDRTMAVRSKDADSARRTLDERVRARLLEIPKRVEVKIDGPSAKITWRGAEKEAIVLDAACSTAAALARAGR